MQDEPTTTELIKAVADFLRNETRRCILARLDEPDLAAGARAG